MSTITEAATVIFLDTVRPKYLAGRVAELVALNGDLAVVQLPDEPGYEAHRGRRLHCPRAVLAWDPA